MSKNKDQEKELKEFKCKACDKNFNSDDKLEEHTYTHDYDYKYNFCHHPNCGELFKGQNLLIFHIQKNHKGKKAFPCKSKGCKISYHTPGRLAMHMKKFHSDELSESDQLSDKPLDEDARLSKRILEEDLTWSQYMSETHSPTHSSDLESESDSDSESEDDDEDDNDKKKKRKQSAKKETKTKVKKRKKKVPELIPAKRPYATKLDPKIKGEERKKIMKEKFPPKPVFECWYKDCCRQFTSEEAITNHVSNHISWDDEGDEWQFRVVV
ncbi:MAG: hypothetical protein EZS28_008057 [Streblomastix strix]|uniref:C2H2-type domain-containing protein n=1 Tax=Streblomastix strix TaxID=222440 RepID=A0A5J4WNL0_9EUKA|nr:MAG: hypothetical protein EZS28_008057 [Streblomastix strix]